MATFDRNEFVNFQFEVDGVKQIVAMLSVRAERVKNVFRIIGPDVKKDFIANQKQQFESEGRHGSGGWPALTDRYRMWKNRHFPGRPMLVLHGDLKASVTDERHPEFVYTVSQTSLVIGTKHWKARIHHPRRPVIELTGAQRTQWPKWMHEAIFSDDMERVNL